MGSKIDAATNAVSPGSTCRACIVASGADLNTIRAVLGPTNKFGSKGTLFVTPGSDLEKQAILDLDEAEVSCLISQSESCS
jgi:delta-1-pyrroline-5-carboxylate synthetase